jgi:hypothetical protein
MAETVGVAWVIGEVDGLSVSSTLVWEPHIETVFTLIDHLGVSGIASMEEVLHDVGGSLMLVLLEHPLVLVDELLIDHAVEYLLNPHDGGLGTSIVDYSKWVEWGRYADATTASFLYEWLGQWVDAVKGGEEQVGDKLVLVAVLVDFVNLEDLPIFYRQMGGRLESRDKVPLLDGLLLGHWEHLHVCQVDEEGRLVLLELCAEDMVASIEYHILWGVFLFGQAFLISLREQSLDILLKDGHLLVAWHDHPFIDPGFNEGSLDKLLSPQVSGYLSLCVNYLPVSTVLSVELNQVDIIPWGDECLLRSLQADEALVHELDLLGRLLVKSSEAHTIEEVVIAVLLFDLELIYGPANAPETAILQVVWKQLLHDFIVLEHPLDHLDLRPVEIYQCLVLFGKLLLLSKVELSIVVLRWDQELRLDHWLESNLILILSFPSLDLLDLLIHSVDRPLIVLSVDLVANHVKQWHVVVDVSNVLVIKGTFVFLLYYIVNVLIDEGIQIKEIIDQLLVCYDQQQFIQSLVQEVIVLS